MKEKFYNELDVTIWWDSSNHRIYADWKNAPSPECVQNGCQAIINLLRERGAHHLLADVIRFFSNEKDAIQWLELEG